ncbi:glycine betaine ABC transporter substrate-binding protein [Desulfobulbus alkaliphilus]|uniref:glycine betaine ABC transporter substrate-binding protein n=1 Tax=Desulfobulbus alkaliphilus TaxID=869814 RepID=UPI001964D22F|nr:glycine betaine ABC transporter substrate-binding protein [Desulfobulbus alkaliphilus]MBM9535531.1 glycine betaine ABC transporter substrate-binding protein [Desulfobulbus alkaliphilus]
MKLLKIVASLAVACCLFVGTAAAQKTARLAYVEWACSVATTHIAGAILEKKGYDVRLTSVAMTAMWASVAAGDSDAMLSAWLPVTHADVYAQYKDQVVDLGPNFVGARLGLVVPEYVTIDSITEMAEHADKFDGRIVGIDPGAGMSQSIDEAIADNTSGLGVFRHLTGSDAIMVASLQQAIRENKWIVVPGWQPHWKFGAWDLKFLADPDGIFGAEETIHTMVRKDLEKDNPELFAFFRDFDWLQLPWESVLVENKEGVDPRQSAAEFVEANWETIENLMQK